MGKAIGPTFLAELQAAGCNLDGFSWGADGVRVYAKDKAQTEIDAIEAVYAAHDPLKPAPPPMRGLAFVKVVHSQLDGATEAARWTRAKKLRVEQAAVAEFVNTLAYDTLISVIRLDIAKTAWATIKAQALLSAGEISRIEALALTYGFSLV